jgi:hypothetical protein
MTGPRDERPRFRHQHRRRPLRWWLLALAAIVAVMVALPRLLALLE